MVTKRIAEWSGILGATVNVRTLEDWSGIYPGNPVCGPSEQESAAVDVAEEDAYSNMFQRLLHAHRVTMGECWESSVCLDPERTTKFTRPACCLPNLFRNSELEMKLLHRHWNMRCTD
jgi:hypothetical protein